jgi:hypothetical protein
MHSLLRSLAALLLVACSTSDKTAGDAEDTAGAQLCADLVDRLRECELLSAGEARCDVPEIERDRCLYACAIEASCDDLWGSVCSDGDLVDLGNAVLSDATVACRSDCLQGAGRFACADGAEVSAGQQCDGQEQCADGSDERDCGDRLFACDSGERVRGRNHCDGYDDCRDDSDEIGCPTFACADGSGDVPQALQCDYAADCPDGSDEDGCAAPQCD